METSNLLLHPNKPNYILIPPRESARTKRFVKTQASCSLVWRSNSKHEPVNFFEPISQVETRGVSRSRSIKNPHFRKPNRSDVLGDFMNRTRAEAKPIRVFDLSSSQVDSSSIAVVVIIIDHSARSNHNQHQPTKNQHQATNQQEQKQDLKEQPDKI